ncbi:uncharacterized protein LOC119103352 [Pollicipes pollicipes]|uniref:uncharacterized protein LOC119103352 n=1 Tax=Pollicipes pollicipes TaxID=41117 RepID=UPI0018859113|nr:uncharacterized protein LOC119103352 [Pollicipes pollicipes]
MASVAALLTCVVTLLCAWPAAVAGRGVRATSVTCYSVHETFRVGQVFSDDNCRRVKCIDFMGQGFVIPVERCPLPDIPEGAECTMTDATDDAFPLCCPKAVCGKL